MLSELEKYKLEKIANYFQDVRKKELENNKNILRVLDLKVSIDSFTDFSIYLKVEDIVELLYDGEEEIETSRVSFLIKIDRFTFRVINSEKTNNKYEYKNYPETEIYA